MNRRKFLTAAGAVVGSGLTTTAAAQDEVPIERNFKYVNFHDCYSATVDGRFTDGDLVYASTGWYDDQGLYGNTLIEHGMEFGPDANHTIDTPFEGQIHVTIDYAYDITKMGDEIHLAIPGAGDDAVLTGLTTDPNDYMTAGITHSNPHADGCLNDNGDPNNGNPDEDSRYGDPDNGGPTDPGEEPDNGPAGEADFEVSILRTNAPVSGGDYLEVLASVENRGDASGTQDVSLTVGHDPEQVDSQSVSLDSMRGMTLRLGYDTYPVDNDQTFPIYVESEDHGTSGTVTVHGTSQTNSLWSGLW